MLNVTTAINIGKYALFDWRSVVLIIVSLIRPANRTRQSEPYNLLYTFAPVYRTIFTKDQLCTNTQQFMKFHIRSVLLYCFWVSLVMQRADDALYVCGCNPKREFNIATSIVFVVGKTATIIPPQSL